MTAFAVTSTDPRVNVFALASVMETKGGCSYYITINSWMVLETPPPPLTFRLAYGEADKQPAFLGPSLPHSGESQ